MDIASATDTINSALRASCKLNNFEKELDRSLQSEQLIAIKSIAESAEIQAASANKEVEILKKQLRLSQNEASDAKKKALLADVIAILSIVVSIVMPLIQSLLR